MLRPAALLFATLLISAPAQAQPSVTTPVPAGPPAPYALEDTAVLGIHSDLLQRDYKLYVSLPASYRTGDRRYPVLFITDADYGFPLLRAISRRVGDHGKGPQDAILIGLSYALGETPEYSRRRDYTPTAAGVPNAVSDMPGRDPVFGGAEAYRQFIAREVFPLIDRSYRTDPGRRIFFGHSYGALLAAHILLTDPTMFQAYVISSPSLFFDHRTMIDQARRYAGSHDDLPARVYLAVGGYETINRKSDDPRFNRTVDMVGDLKAFQQILASRTYPGLSLRTEIIPSEDHLTVNPISYTHGLAWALAPARSSAPAKD
jgi:predicted alpha/beta superfamily hydrolase